MMLTLTIKMIIIMNLTSVSSSYDDIRDVHNSTSIPAGPLKPVRKLQILNVNERSGQH